MKSIFNFSRNNFYVSFLMGIAAINTAVAFVSYMHRFDSSSILLIFGFINIFFFVKFYVMNKKYIYNIGLLFISFVIVIFIIFNPSVVYAEEVIKEVVSSATAEPTENPYKRTQKEWILLGVRYSIFAFVIIGFYFWPRTGGPNPGPGFPPGPNPGPGFPPGGNPGPGFPPGGNPGPGFPPAQDGGAALHQPNLGSWNQDLVDMVVEIVQNFGIPVGGALLIGAEIAFGESSPDMPESSPDMPESSPDMPESSPDMSESSPDMSTSQPLRRSGKEEEEDTSSRRSGKEEEEDTSVRAEADLDTESSHTSSYTLNFEELEVPDSLLGHETEVLEFFEQITQFLASSPEFAPILGTVYPFFLGAVLDGVRVFVPYIVFNHFFFTLSFEQQFRLLDFPEFVESLVDRYSPLRGLARRGANVPGLLNVVNQLGLNTLLQAHFAGASYSTALAAVRNFVSAWQARVCPTFREVFLQSLNLLDVVIKATTNFNKFLQLILKQAEGDPRVSITDLEKLKKYYERFSIMYTALLRYEIFLHKIEATCKKFGANYNLLRFPFNLEKFFPFKKLSFRQVFINIL